jgi:hypothetical protein
MRIRAMNLVLAGLFAIAIGHLAWMASLGPAFTPNYFIGGGPPVPVLTGTDPTSKVLYLRRNYYLPQRTRHAWIKVLGYDEIWVYVNGQLVEEQDVDGFPVGVVADITPYLRFGHNVIGLASRQSTIGKPPMVHVEGEITLEPPMAHVEGEIPLDDDPRVIKVDGKWRCSHQFARRAHYWMSDEFDDRTWDRAVIASEYLRSPIKVPEEGLTTPRRGQWLTLPNLTDTVCSVRREFTVPSRPARSWLRLTTSCSYRLSLNGIPIDQQENEVGTAEPVPPVRRLYEVTPALQTGANVLAVALTGTGNVPQILAEMEVVDSAGNAIQVNTDSDWLGHSGLSQDWLSPRLEHPEEWQPCHAETGDLKVIPWQPRTLNMQLDLPAFVLLPRWAAEAAFILAIALATLIVTNGVAVWLTKQRGLPAGSPPSEVAFLALVPVTATIAVAFLSVYDPQIGPQHVYWVPWLIMALLTVPLQWALLWLLAIRTRVFNRLERNVRFAEARRTALTFVGVLGLMALGFGLRLKDMDLEPLQWDEVEVYRSTVGTLQLGFPNYKAHPDQPYKFTETSELVFPVDALTALFTDNDRWICRFPCVVWGTLIIGLLYWIGREFFGYIAGLIAAAIYTIAPPCIAMDDFGRYFAQLRFMSLLTIYFFWLTVRGPGPINRKALWLTALSFVGLYLTWECGALIAPSLMVAALIQRRGRLGTILLEPQVWIAMLVAALFIGLQYSHRELQQTLFMWYGISVSDIVLKPMWRYPTFKPLYYLWESTYSQDIFVPFLGFLAACVVALRHKFREPVRLLLIVHVMTALIMTCLLPAFAWRYADYLVAPLILECAAAYAAIGWRLAKYARESHVPVGWRYYAGSVATLVVLLIIVIGSGRVIRLIEMPRQAAEGYGTVVFKFPNLGGPTEYLREHWRPGDAILASDPQQIHHLLNLKEGEDHPDSFWPATSLFVPATLDDRRTLPIERRDGTKMIPDLKQLEEVFARYDRVWYLVSPDEHHRLNVPELSTFIRENMDLVYEDFQSLTFLRDRNHRSPALRKTGEKELVAAQSNFLP